MPGSPPIKVTEPGTRPPPNTRSSSAEPVASAGLLEHGLGRQRGGHVHAGALWRGSVLLPRVGRDDLGHQGVPFAAAGALPLPFRRSGSAVLANKHLFGLRHWSSFASICELSIAVTHGPITYTAGLLDLDYVYCMRKFGLIAAIVGLGTLGSGLLLRAVAHVNTWLWLPGFVLLCGGSALFLWSRFAASASAVPAPKIPEPHGYRYRAAAR